MDHRMFVNLAPNRQAPRGSGANTRRDFMVLLGGVALVTLLLTAGVAAMSAPNTAAGTGSAELGDMVLMSQPTGDCMRFIADANYPDNTSVRAGQSIDKAWRLQNCGSNWNGVQAVRIGGSYGPSSFGVPQAGANQTLDVHATFNAPSGVGQHQRATYQLRGPRGNFGPTFWVELNVTAAPQSPQPQPQPQAGPRPAPQPQPQPGLDQGRLTMIRKLYESVLGRPADDGGLISFYHSALNERQIHDVMLASPECRQGNGGECRGRRFDGALVQASGDSASYVLSGGQRHHVPDTGTYWTIYFSNGQHSYNNWSHEQVYGIPEGGTATAPAYPPADEGAIATDPNAHSYLLQGQQKHAIPDTATYADIKSHNNNRAYNYGWDRINRITTGSSVPSVTQREQPQHSTYKLPVPSGTLVYVTQGNNSPKPLDHNGPSEYAFDFANRGQSFSVTAIRGGRVIAVQSNSTQNCKGLDLDEHGNRLANCWTLANFVLIDHGDGTSALYMHLAPNSIRVKEGQTISQKQVLATAGNTGFSTGIHLHVQVEATPCSTEHCQQKRGWWFTQSKPLAFSDQGVRAIYPNGVPDTNLSRPLRAD